MKYSLEIKTGVRQGCIFSLIIFNYALRFSKRRTEDGIITEARKSSEKNETFKRPLRNHYKDENSYPYRCNCLLFGYETSPMRYKWRILRSYLPLISKIHFSDIYLRSTIRRPDKTDASIFAQIPLVLTVP